MPFTLPDWQPSAPLHILHFDWLTDAGIEVAILRLDLLDPLISGNKWFKLKPHIAAAAEAGYSGLMSLGGAHSNHLHALAAAGQRFAFETVGLLRGEPQETPTVRDLQSFGMRLHWLGYAGYRQRHRADFWQDWQARYPELLPVNEGGSGLLAALACRDIVEIARAQLPGLDWDDYHGWWLAAGTGTTAARCMSLQPYQPGTAWKCNCRAFCVKRAGRIPVIACWMPAVADSGVWMPNWRTVFEIVRHAPGLHWSRCIPARHCWHCAMRWLPGTLPPVHAC